MKVAALNGPGGVHQAIILSLTEHAAENDRRHRAGRSRKGQPYEIELNLYEYCGGAPARNVDPSGEKFGSCFLCGAALGAGFAIVCVCSGICIRNHWDRVGEGFTSCFFKCTNSVKFTATLPVSIVLVNACLACAFPAPTFLTRPPGKPAHGQPARPAPGGKEGGRPRAPGRGRPDGEDQQSSPSDLNFDPATGRFRRRDPTATFWTEVFRREKALKLCAIRYIPEVAGLKLQGFG